MQSVIKHENCSKLEERMKFGIKIYLGMEKSNRFGAMQESMRKPFQREVCFRSLCLLVKK